ncbi:hypothetical protein BJ165DRAFT_1524971 [Panaeolus papilionaceus]|nr:hypothetical protein BJ165DRAFT_1524971 [Panaeolus papilionaceus]
MASIHHSEKVAPVLRNIQLAVIFLTYLMQADFHGMLPDWTLAVCTKTLVLSDTIPPDCNVADYISELAVRRPLHIAALVSPIFLLSRMLIESYRWESDSLLLYVQSLGNDKPPLLRRVEIAIWNTLLDLAKSNISLVQGVERLLVELPWSDLHEAPPEITSWFDLTSVSVPDQSNVPLGPSSSQSASNTPLQQSQLVILPNATAGVNSPVTTLPVGPDSLCNGASDSGHEPAQSSVSIQDPDVDRMRLRERPPQKPPVVTKQVIPRPTTTKRKNTEEHSARLSVPTPFQMGFAHKKRLGSVRIQSLTPEPFLFLPTLEPSPQTQSHLLSHGYWDPKPVTTLECTSVPKPFQCDFQTFLLDGSERAFPLAFHDKETLQRVLLWKTAIEKSYVTNTDGLSLPRWLAQKEESAFKLLPFTSMHDDRLVQETLSRNHIIFYDCPSTDRMFDLEALNNIHSVRSVIDIHDLSVDCCTQMPDGKILNALDLKLPTGSMEIQSFSSDLIAWRVTDDEVLCPKDELLPVNQMRWALVSSRAAVHWSHMDYQGQATFVEPQVGAKLWIVAKELDDSETGTYEHLDPDFDPSYPSDKWEYEAFVLTPNLKLPLSYDDLLEVIGMFLGNVVMYKDMAALHGVQGAPGCNVELMQNWITKSFTVNGLETAVVKGYRLYVTGESTAPSEASLPILSIPFFEKIETKTHDPYPLHTTAQLVDMGWSDAENDLERGITTSFGKCSM